MKKVLAICLTAVMALGIAGCGGAAKETAAASSAEETAEAAAAVDYGESEIYTQEDMDPAIALIEEQIAGWSGVELHNVRYAGDDQVTQENLDRMNEAGEGKTYAQCIAFLTDFHSPKEEDNKTTLNSDEEYTDYQWWLAREEGGDWEIVDSGY